MQKIKILIILIFILAVSILLAQTTFTENQIGLNFEEPWSVFPVDMDGDDDLDILASARLDNKITWWENIGSEDFFYHQISDQSLYAMGVVSMDIDNDLDIDVVCASQVNGVELWINDGNQNFQIQIIGSWNCPTYVDSADVNLDGMPDILVACCENNSNRIGWIENLGGLNFTSHNVMTNWHQANSIDAGDIDSDGDIDIIGTASGREDGEGEIIVFYNDGNQVFVPDTLFVTQFRPSYGIIRDLDLDGDMDVVASVCNLNQAIWFENNNNQFEAYQIIGYGMNRGLALEIADFDNDNDMDVVSSSINLDRIYWFENIEMDFTRHIITSNLDGGADVYPVDIDLDGDIDILSTAQYANRISIWENQFLTKVDENQVTDLNTRARIYNYPNLFNPSTYINYEIHESGFMEINIYDVKGQKIRSLVNQNYNAGKYSIGWDGEDEGGQKLSSGIYLYKLIMDGSIENVNKCLLLK